MDPATVIGLLIAFGSLIVMVLLEGGSLSSLLLPAPQPLLLAERLRAMVPEHQLRSSGKGSKTDGAAEKLDRAA